MSRVVYRAVLSARGHGARVRVQGPGGREARPPCAPRLACDVFQISTQQRDGAGRGGAGLGGVGMYEGWLKSFEPHTENEEIGR